jgi:streptomycin 3"-kinase
MAGVWDGHAAARQDLPSCPPGLSWEPVHGESDTAVFRRSDGAVFAKWSAPAGGPELDGERERLAWLSQFDQKSPNVVDWLTSPTGVCLVTSAVPGVAASDLRGPQLYRSWPSLVTSLRRLHMLPLERCPFERRLDTMLAKAEDVVRRGALNPQFLAPQDRALSSEALLQRVLGESGRRRVEESDDLVVCHGDACLPNFMVDPETMKCTGVVDLGRLGLADRYADLALLVGNARSHWSSEVMGTDALGGLRAAYGLARLDEDRLNYYLRLDPLTWG